ncbi:unnamed protein product [Mesocestoides corti]|uniref:Uncharacterized protein n=2 Tax=Mesocestoides corti TaxID=53468 RepID=A0A0R3UQ86_MESCO|nr:unnamed protein product [Mesocestoides corti]
MRTDWEVGKSAVPNATALTPICDSSLNSPFCHGNVVVAEPAPNLLLPLSTTSDYMLTIPISKRPDIHQVAALTFSLLDRPNPVPNVNSSDVPDWLDLPLPRSESDRTAPTARHTAAEGTSVSSAAKSVGLASPPQAAVSEAPQHHTTTTSPCIARQRPRASQTCGRDSTGVVPALAKPPSVQRSSQEPSKSPSHVRSHLCYLQSAKRPPSSLIGREQGSFSIVFYL